MTGKLDNPVWHCLLETNQTIAIVYEGARFYHPDYCPFGAFKTNNAIPKEIDEYASLTENFYIVGEKPRYSDKIILKNELVCLQMIADCQSDIEPKNEILRLNSEYDEELFNLVNLVQPGFFRRKTVLMGEYYGIFVDGELVAVTGERMKMIDHTEVSAVVTHPNFTGRGFAKQLTAHTMNKIMNENKNAYLHVNEKNVAAIKLYESLGFKTRRKMSFWNLVCKFTTEW
ncbi:MAG: GNAT family N-acetyltransferase [Chitinophagaceae bacterium]|nr:GNAT family N-acetyltransferase [Chitinophagaceae bacterium]